MKKILILIGFLYSLNSFSQSTVLLRGDTIKVYKQGGDAVLKVEGHLMLKDFRQGNSNDSVLTWDPVTLKVRMVDRSTFGGGGSDPLKLNISDTATMLSTYINAVGYGLLRTGQTARFDSATVFSNLTWDRVLSNEPFLTTYYRPKIYKNLEIDMNNKHFFISNADDFGVNLNGNEWAISGNNGGDDGTWMYANPAPQYLEIFAGINNPHFSNIKISPDSIQFKPYLGKINIDSLRSATDTVKNKPMVWNVDNGMVSRLTSWPSGGGSGTPGGSNKQVQYNNSSAFGGYTGFEVGNTNNDVLITAGATTSVPLNIKLQSSQTANALNISSSSGTGDLFKVAASGETTIYSNLGVGATAFAPLSIKAAITPSYGQMSIAPASGTGNAAIVYQSYYDAVGTRLMVMGLGHYGGAGDAIYYFANEISGGGVAFRNGLGNTFSVLNTGAANLAYYGSGTFTGTPAKYLAVESDGDIIEATASSLKPSLNKGVFLESPTSADTLDVWQTPVAITITSLKAILRGASPSVTYNIGFGTNIQSPTAVFTADITCTSITTGCSNSSGFNDATIPAGSFIWIYTNAASGTIRSISFTINYTED